MNQFTRQQMLILGCLGLAVCLVCSLFIAFGFSLRIWQSLAADQSATPSLVARVQTFPPTWTPQPTEVPATPTRVIQVTPIPSINRVLVRQQLVAPILPDATTESAVTSLDRRHVAHLYRESNGEFIALDGQRGKTYEAIDCCQIVWSPNSQRLAFVANKGNQAFVVLDGKEGKPYDTIFNIKFSPNSQRLIYGAKHDNKSFVVVDDKESKPYDRVGELVFSPDSKRYGYAGTLTSTEGDKARVVLDGIEDKAYDAIVTNTLRFSPDSQRVAYAAAITSRQSTYSDLPTFQSVAFHAQSKRRYLLVLDGQEGTLYDSIIARSLSFSPNSQRLAYVAGNGTTQFAVVDGKEGKPYHCIAAQMPPLFSPDSRRVAYGACDGARWFAVLDEKENKAYDTIGYDPTSGQSIVFSQDSRQVVYAAQEGSQWFVVVNGKEGKRYDGIVLKNPFSPNSQRLAFVADQAKSTFAVIDGNELGPYSIGRGGIVFSPDSRHAAYIVYDDKTEGVIIDGVKGLYFQTILGDGDGRIVFDSADTLHYLAAVPFLRPPGIYLIQEKIE